MFGPNFRLSTLAMRAQGTHADLSQLQSLRAWFDPSDLSTLYQDAAATLPVASDGDPVGTMLDKSGNGYHVIQSNAAARPTYRTNGSRHWLEFNGIDSGLSVASRLGLSANPSITISAHLQPLNYNSADSRVVHIGGNTTGNLGAGIGPSGNGQAWRYDNGNVVFSSPATNSDHVLSWVRSQNTTYGAGRAFSASSELNALASSSSGMFPSNTDENMSIGTHGSKLYVNMKLYALVILNSDSEQERLQSEAWVSSR